MQSAENGYSDGDAVAVFAALADETRWAIVRELATYRREGWRPEGVSFADLRRAVGISDAGRFSYHLTKLQDGLVFENDGEYVLSNRGLELVGAVLAGAYGTAEPRTEETDERCPRCPSSLRAIYEHGYLRLECPDHGRVLAEVVPAVPARRLPIDELVALAGRRSRNRIALAAAGICSHCQGTVETSVEEELTVFEDGEDHSGAGIPVVSSVCADCGFHTRLLAHVRLVVEPAVVAFRHDIGDDQSGIPFLGTEIDRISGALTDDGANVTFRAGEECLVVSLDDSGRVVTTDRR